MISPANSDINAAERAEQFHEEYDHGIDAGATLATIVIGAGDYLARIIGREAADAGMMRMIEPLLLASNKSANEHKNWRDALDASVSHCFSTWPLGGRLHDLAAYAYYGITLHGSSIELERAQHIEGLVDEAQAFLDATPILQWTIELESQLSRLVLLARNRWELDNGRPVEPAALAHFGGVSEGRIRNLMSGPKSALPSDGGRIPAQQALAWLAGRNEFWNSIWREQQLPQYGVKHRAPLKQAVFLPVARDDRPFHPGLQRGGRFTIGEKGEEVQVAGFDAALAALQRMPKPLWRRPNDSGNWGIVRGVRWTRVDASDLEILAANPQHKIPENDRV
jgi:hypothetical protein